LEGSLKGSYNPKVDKMPSLVLNEWVQMISYQINLSIIVYKYKNTLIRGKFFDTTLIMFPIVTLKHMNFFGIQYFNYA